MDRATVISLRAVMVRPAPAVRHCGSGECVRRRFRVTRAQVAAPGGRAVNAPGSLYAISAPTEPQWLTGTFRLQRHRIRVDDCVDESDEGDGIIDVGRNCIFYDESVDSLGDRVVESTLIERVVFPILETRLDVRQGKALSIVAAIFPLAAAVMF